MCNKEKYSNAMSIAKNLEENGLNLRGKVVDICLFQNEGTENIGFDVYFNEDESSRLMKYNPNKNELFVDETIFSNISDNVIISSMKNLLELIDVYIANVELLRVSSVF